ncbi:MAG: tetratricopeptide repeat protein [Candidatus Acidiferrum sp.]
MSNAVGNLGRLFRYLAVIPVAGLLLGTPDKITIDYPEEGSIFPPEIAPPTFVWRDASPDALSWRIDISFEDRTAPLHTTSDGPRMKIGASDPDCVSEANLPPQLTAEEAAAHTWSPGTSLWESIKKHQTATLTFTGLSGAREVSSGQVTIHTSKDAVGAPIFYRDVPLMPTEMQTGVIQPLAAGAVRLIAWRIRDIAEPRSRLLLEGLPMCANCHSFSNDGKTLGMDLDGLQHNRGMYTLTPVQKNTRIGEENVIQWSTNKGPLKGDLRIGFMSQVSPDGDYVLTTIDWPPNLPNSNYYVANFPGYRFLQVFFPTRGILAWYSRKTGILHPLPGADDPSFVQMGGVWSPDGKYVVFARAKAQEPNAAGAPAARFANDPNETQIQYDLYRIPFRDGQGGTAEPIEGASQNGMSNSFPKISPDGRWIVFVKARNGLLMRPDSELYIVPAEGGKARRLQANRAPMNSWHSFSPNGRWLVFSSKRQSPYTRMYLTHIDAEGNDSPAILIENATAANRAVNLPEFVNIPAEQMRTLGGPVVEYFKLFDRAMYYQKQAQYGEAIRVWKQLLEIRPKDGLALGNLGAALLLAGRGEEAGPYLREAQELKLKEALKVEPQNPAVHNDYGVFLLESSRPAEAQAEFLRAIALGGKSAGIQVNLGRALVAQGASREALPHLQNAVELDRNSADAHAIFGDALYESGNVEAALSQWRESLRLMPDGVPALRHMAWVLATSANDGVRGGKEALTLALRAVQATGGKDARSLDALAAAYAENGQFDAAVRTADRAVLLATPEQAGEIRQRVALYKAEHAYRSNHLFPVL